jgi:hypothetical protein
MLAVDVVAALDNIITRAREAVDWIEKLLHLQKKQNPQQNTFNEDLDKDLDKRGAERDEARKKLDAVMAGLVHGAGVAGAVGRADASRGFATEFSYDKGQGSKGAAAAAGKRGDVNITQHIHTSSHDPKKVGQAASQGAATGVQKANYNASKGTNKP